MKAEVEPAQKVTMEFTVRTTEPSPYQIGKLYEPARTKKVPVITCLACPGTIFRRTDHGFKCARCGGESIAYVEGVCKMTPVLTPTERLVAEHPHWDRHLIRAGIATPEIKAVVHFRHRLDYGIELLNWADNLMSHTAVIVLYDGHCYWSQATFANHPYNRKLQRLRAVGRALKRVSNAWLNNHHTPDCDFIVDLELEGRDLYKAVVRGWLAYGALGPS